MNHIPLTQKQLQRLTQTQKDTIYNLILQKQKKKMQTHDQLKI